MKKLFLNILQYSQESICVGVSFFDKITGLKASNFIKKRPVNIGKVLRTPILKKICERLHL